MGVLRTCICTVVLLSLSASSSAAQADPNEKKATYLIIQVAGALGTYPMSINNSLAVTGYYFVTSTVAYGFVRDGGGILTTFKVGGSLWTEPESINAAGDITGFYETVAGAPQGFIRYANGRIVTFNPPCFGGANCEALPVSINDFKDVAGNYPSPLEDIHSVSGGFKRTAGGVFTSYVLTQGGDYPTVVTGMNASGGIVGYFGNDLYTAFLVHPDGFMIEFHLPWQDVVGAVPQGGNTFAESINADGLIAGWYRFCSSDPCETTTSGGFVRSPEGVFTLFNPPGTIVTLPGSGPFYRGEQLSAPNRINMNQQGTIAGSYTDANLAQHGFVRDPYGVITSFDPPRGMETTATSINDSGVIAGSFYYDWDPRTPVGFLRIPNP